MQLAASLNAVNHLLDDPDHRRVFAGQLRDLCPCLLGQVDKTVRVRPLYLRVQLVKGSQSLVGRFVHVVHEVIELYCLVEPCLEGGLD